MRYTKKLPLADRDKGEKLLAEGWRMLREPSDFKGALLSSIPFGVLCGVLTLLLVYLLGNDALVDIMSGRILKLEIRIGLDTFLYLVGIFLFSSLHELIHGLFIPGFFKGENSIVGGNLLGLFVHTDRVISKRRHMVISLAPFILLSLVSPLIMSLFGGLGFYVGLLALINGLGSSIDLMNAWNVGVQVPSGAMLVSNGMETYFR